MGLVSTKFFRAILGKKDVRILMMGLDAAGKTTTLYKLKLGEVVTAIPTIGYNVETIEYKNVNLTTWDVGGRTKLRALWRHYMQNTSGVIFMVDSNDRERMPEATKELRHLIEEPLLRDIPVLVIANKQDLPDAMSISEIADQLDLYDSLAGRRWHIQAACATAGDGLYDGLDWLSDAIAGHLFDKSAERPAPAPVSSTVVAGGDAGDALSPKGESWNPWRQLMAAFHGAKPAVSG
eukprot:TRINITY_DN1387_c0_g2_i1.p1 TRINITY_DN1387_c0_g2~~TRINITY_DN1387_c0_g2_i1.p1  ORF type:complete len:236 (+),score=32.85 TRINITY_DN1387_c0_g2_i1:57-764(+)